MRGIETPVREIRRRVFKEIAKFAYEQKDLSKIEDLPYEIVPGEIARYRDSIYRERAVHNIFPQYSAHPFLLKFLPASLPVSATFP